MEYAESNPDPNKEGLEKIAQIVVLSDFDMNAKLEVSNELLALLRAKGDPDLLASFQVEAETKHDATEA